MATTLGALMLDHVFVAALRTCATVPTFIELLGAHVDVVEPMKRVRVEGLVAPNITVRPFLLPCSIMFHFILFVLFLFSVHFLLSVFSCFFLLLFHVHVFLPFSPSLFTFLFPLLFVLFTLLC